MKLIICMLLILSLTTTLVAKPTKKTKPVARATSEELIIDQVNIWDGYLEDTTIPAQKVIYRITNATNYDILEIEGIYKCVFMTDNGKQYREIPTTLYKGYIPRKSFVIQEDGPVFDNYKHGRLLSCRVVITKIIVRRIN